MYSQSREESIINAYFEDFKGSLVDIGANDGVTLSNSRALIEKGWKAHLFEPSPKAFAKLQELYADNNKVKLHQIAVAEETGTLTFFESDSHAEKQYGENVGLLSTLKESEILRWKGTQVFEKIEVEAKTWRDTRIKKFDFINIDAEGLDWQILRQIDLSSCSLVCVEFNNNRNLEILMKNYCEFYKLSLDYKTHENLIFCR